LAYDKRTSTGVSGTTSYTYNADGTLASKTDANGNTETYTYDAYQRLTVFPDRQQTFTYDTCRDHLWRCDGFPERTKQLTPFNFCRQWSGGRKPRDETVRRAGGRP